MEKTNNCSPEQVFSSLGSKTTPDLPVRAFGNESSEIPFSPGDSLLIQKFPVVPWHAVAELLASHQLVHLASLHKPVDDGFKGIAQLAMGVFDGHSHIPDLFADARETIASSLECLVLHFASS